MLNKVTVKYLFVKVTFILTMDQKKIYLGASETPFRERFRNHTRDFKHKRYEKMVWVSIYVWSLKSQGIVAIIKLRITKRIKSKVSSNYCKLCLTEKFYIIQYPDDNILFNRKSELLSKSRHQKILLLNNLKRNDSMD